MSSTEAKGVWWLPRSSKPLFRRGSVEGLVRFRPASVIVQSANMSALLAFYAFAIGAIVGSFLNVVIYRYPRELSVVRPRSHLPNCDPLIRWYDNIPILSYLLLRARCRQCRAPISIRYPLIELANGLFYLAVFLRTGPTVSFLLVAAIVSMTVVLIFIDLHLHILPDGMH